MITFVFTKWLHLSLRNDYIWVYEMIIFESTKWLHLSLRNDYIWVYENDYIYVYEMITFESTKWLHLCLRNDYIWVYEMITFECTDRWTCMPAPSSSSRPSALTSMLAWSFCWRSPQSTQSQVRSLCSEKKVFSVNINTEKLTDFLN